MPLLVPKLTIEFNDKAAIGIAQLAGKTKQSNVDVVRRALLLYDFLVNGMCKHEKLAILDKEGNVSRIVVFTGIPS